MLIAAAVCIFVLVAMMYYQAVLLHRVQKVKYFWYEKWRDECEAHLETSQELTATEEGVFEIEESYEMDRLTANETIYSLRNWKETYEPTVDRYFRLDKFHEETCVPLLSQAHRGAR